MPTSASVRLFSTVSDSKRGSPFIQPIVLGRWWRAQWTTGPYSDGLRFIVRDSMGDKAVLNNLRLVHPQCPVLHSHKNLFAQLHWLPSANTLKVPESFSKNLYSLFLMSHNCWSDQILWKAIYDLVYNLSSSNCNCNCKLQTFAFVLLWGMYWRRHRGWDVNEERQTWIFEGNFLSLVAVKSTLPYHEEIYFRRRHMPTKGAKSK